jgi:ABC-type branched-subunit amino acid transport system ATPase component/ABC-type branched-subunit amino acid transport system permease subunit
MTLQRTILIAGVALVAATSPFFGIPGWTPSLATVSALLAISLIGLNLIFGFCGMLALGQAAFAVIPAYISGILSANGVPILASALIGFALTIVIARILAEIFIRLPGIYLAVGTLGFSYVIEGIARAYPGVTGGASGLVLTMPFVLSETQWYVVAVIAVTVATLLSAWLLRGATARTLKLLHRDELAAAVAGIDVVRLKVRMFSIGAAFTAAGGLLLTYYTSVVTPEMGGANNSLEYLALVMIGGAGSIVGPIIGAASIGWLFSVAGAAHRYELLVYGASFLAVVLFAPGGIASLFSRFLPKIAGGTPQTPVVASVSGAPLSPVNSGAGLQVADVSKRFGGLQAVGNVSLDVAHGEVVAVLGPNGAGKSTFFNILSGIERADSGSILLDGKPITDVSIHIRAAVIGRSFQVPRLVLDMTVLQNIISRVDQMYPALSEDHRRSMAFAELNRFRLADMADTMVGEVAVGHHKLIDIARAAVGTPALVLLDEPAVGLTGVELAALKDIIHTLARGGSAVVVVDHNIDFIMSIADRILVMEGGRTLASGKPRDVIESPEVRAAYLGVLA